MVKPAKSELGRDARALLELRQPEIFLKRFLGVKQVWQGQADILDAIVKHERTSVKSGHSLGKDYITAAIALWFVMAYVDSVVITTAPTGRQVEFVIWGEINQLYKNAPVPLGGRMLTTHFTPHPDRKWYLTGFTTRDSHATGPGKFQGFHARHVLVIFSEAQAIEKGIWDQAESLMTGSHVRWLVIGNPLVSAGAFYETFLPKSQWHNLTLDCEKNPNFLAGEEVIPGLASRAWVKGMEAKYGRESPTFQSKVKGEFPKRGSNAFIDLAWLEWANHQGLNAIRAEGAKVVGCDPASVPPQGEKENLDADPDKTVFAVRQGMQLTHLIKYERKSTMETAGLLVEWLQKGYIVVLDVTGIGAGIYHRLVELGYGGKVIPVNFGGACDKERKDADGRTPHDKYANIVTQIYAHLAWLLENRRAAMEYDAELNTQLLTRKMFTLSNGRMILESKKDYGTRGYHSPDEADAVGLAYAETQLEHLNPRPMAQVEEDQVLGDIFGQAGDEDED